jgi:hypothetical protein
MKILYEFHVTFKKQLFTHEKAYTISGLGFFIFHLVLKVAVRIKAYTVKDCIGFDPQLN